MRPFPLILALAVTLAALLAPQTAHAHSFAGLGVALVAIFLSAVIGVPLLGLEIATVVMLIRGTAGKGTKIVSWITLVVSVIALGNIVVQAAISGRHVGAALVLNVPLFVFACLGLLFSLLLLRRVARQRR